MSDSENNSTSEGAGLDNSPVIARKKSKFTVGGVGSWLAIAVVLVIILTVLIVRSQDREEDVLSFAPADSYFAYEIENLEGACEVVARMPLWKEEAFNKEKLFNEFVEWFDQDAELIKRFREVIKSFTYIESFVDRKPVRMVVLRAGNTWDIESYFRREYSSVTTPVKVAEDLTGLEITRKDKSVFYLKKIANFVIITENKALLKRSLACYTKDELSLADCNIRFGDGNSGMPRLRIYTAINSYFINYPQSRSFFPPNVYSMIAGDSAFLYEATINDSGFVAEGRIIRSIAAAYATGDELASTGSSGFWSVVGWLIVILLIIIIGLPLLFVLSTLLLALYFFLIAWWKGELVEIDPPLTEMSKEMAEDLATGKSSIGKKPGKNSAVNDVSAMSESDDNKGLQDETADSSAGEKADDKDSAPVSGNADKMKKKADSSEIATAETIIVNRKKAAGEPEEDKADSADDKKNIALAETMIIEREPKDSQTPEDLENSEDKKKDE